MVLLCSGTRVLRTGAAAAPNVDAVECVDTFVAALDAAAAAAQEHSEEVVLPLSDKTAIPVRGDDVALLVVLQREAGCVAAASPATGVQERIASVDATTCVIVALRDAATQRVALGHFDSANAQTKDGLTLLLTFVLNLAASRPADAPVAQLELYMLGATRHEKYSANTLAALLTAMANRDDVEFNAAPGNCCVWSQNVPKAGGAGPILHRSLMVDAGTGKAFPVVMDARRAYPENRIRCLRCFDESELLSPISLLPSEKFGGTAARPRGFGLAADDGQAPAFAGDGAAPAVVVVRPFKWPKFSEGVAQMPLEGFLAMSTSPEMEPEDFAANFKAAMIYGSLTQPMKVFEANAQDMQGRPVVHQLMRVGDADAAAKTRDGEPAVAPHAWVLMD
jgi:hypothetical protein